MSSENKGETFKHFEYQLNFNGRSQRTKYNTNMLNQT